MERRSIDTQRGYDLWAPSYDSTENPVVALDDRFVPPMVEALVPGRTRCIVDAGCGTGRHTEWLAGRADRVVALDFSDGMLEQARGRLAGTNNVVFIQQDLARTPYPALPERCASGALCALVGEHLDDLPAFFREMQRVLEPGGWLVFSVYHPFLAFLGKEANFVASDGQWEYRLGANRHLASDYVNALRHAGMELEQLHEVVVTNDLCHAIPAAGKLRDMPALLVVAGRVPG